MTLITITIAVSIVLTTGAISLALEDHLLGDSLKRVRLAGLNLRTRIHHPIGRLRREA